MAKKNIVRVKGLFDFKIEAGSNGMNTMKLWGKNSKGTEVSISIEVEDWYMPYIVEGAYKTAKEKFERAKKLKERCKLAVDANITF